MKKLLVILFLLCGCLTIGGVYDNTTTDGFKEALEIVLIFYLAIVR